MSWGKKPLLEELFLELLESDVQVTHALDTEFWYAPSRGNTPMRPKAMTFMPFSGRKRSFPAMPRNITHLSALPSSLSVK